ncbi:MFS transporter [Candidatus Bathyarchaeota archaeon]|nr:MFS transporter [Candidatus Bathyarchaeota archaeon]
MRKNNNVTSDFARILGAIIHLFKEYRNMPKEANYLIYSMIFPALAYGMFYMDLPYLLTHVKGISTEFMGAIMTMMGVSMVASSIPFGILADRFSRRQMLIFGNIIASTTIAVFTVTNNNIILLAAALFEGISEAAISSSSSALLADKATDEKRNSVFSFSGFTQNIAFGLGGFIIPVVAVFEVFGYTTQESHSIMYVTIATLSLASTLLLLNVTDSKKPRERAKVTFKSIYPKKSGRILAKYLLTSVIIAFGAGMIVPLMSVWFGYRFSIPDTLSGPILGASSFLIGAATLGSPAIARKLGIVKAIVVTQGASTLFMFLTPIMPEFISASVIYSFRSFLMNMAAPLQQSMIMGLVLEEERGITSVISSALWKLPNSLSTFIGAWLMGLGLLSAPFYLASVLYLMSIFLFWYFFKDTKMSDETRSVAGT